MQVRQLDHIVLNVTDVERSLAWYTELLGLEPERVDDWRAGRVPFPSVRIDEACIIDLFGVAPTGENLNHFCLVVDPGDVAAIATDDRFDVVAGPARRWGALGDGLSVYVRDPDGNTVELRSYA
jgi:catechol 2,3-dioxygenase-like lactoylglutathione lyase family enzyme